MSSIPSRGIGVREKSILAMPSVGVGGETHVCRNKCVDRTSSKEIIGLVATLEVAQQCES